MKTICTAAKKAAVNVTAAMTVSRSQNWGSLVVTPLGEGKVTGINRAMRTASVQLTPDNVIQVEWDEIVDASKADPI